MKFKLLLIFCVSMLFAGCASVPTERALLMVWTHLPSGSHTEGELLNRGPYHESHCYFRYRFS